MTDFRPVIRIAPNNQVFDLPVIVGIEEGLFEAAGLDVKFSATHADREKDAVGGAIMARLKENLFDCGSADSYNVCEWASIDRLERGSPRRQYRGAARGGGGAGDLVVRRGAAGAARPRRRAGRRAGAHRLALLHLADAGERGRRRSRQDRGRRPAADALGRAQERHLPRGHGHGAVHQPRAQGGRAHHRGVVLSRRRGDRGRSDAASSARPITTPRTGRST